MPDKKFVDTRKGTIAYLERGRADAPPLLLVHGIPTSSYLWRHVMRILEADFRCLAPDLMGLGDTVVDPARTDFGMPSQAEMLDEFLEAVGAPRAHIVGHDQGGAAVQLLCTRREARVDRLVLTDCVCYDNWPVPAIAQLQRFARLPLLPGLVNRSGLMLWLETKTRLSRFRAGVVRREALTDEAIAEYLRPTRGTADQQERFRRFLLAGDGRHTMNAVPALRQFRRPTLILWAAEDHYIPVKWARRLYEDIPGASRLEIVPGAGHFWPEEAPEPFAARIREFLLAPEVKRPAVDPAVDAAVDAAEPALVSAERLTRKKCADKPRRRS